MMAASDSIIQILCIEGAARTTSAIKNALEQQGSNFALTVINSRTELFEAVRDSRWDVILAAYALNAFTAAEALDIVQQAGRDIPFIVISDGLGDEAAVELIKQGVDDYLLVDRLLRLNVAIEQAINQRHLKREQHLIQAKLQAIFDHTQDVIVVVNPQNGRILEVNRAIMTQLGYLPNQVIDQPWVMLYAASEGECPIEECHDGKPVTQMHLAQPISGADGNIHLMDLKVSPIAWFFGTACLLTLHDVTQRERITAAEREADRLNLALQKEREVNHFRSEIIKTISHEFRTPLTSIQISSNLLANYYDRISPEKRQNYAANLKKQSGYLLHLLDEVAEADTNEMQRNPDFYKWANPTELIDHQIQSFRAESDGPFEIKFQPPASDFYYEICVNTLIKTFSQLLENSMKFSPQGGLINVELISSNDAFEFVIQDHGIGIADEDLDNIFKPFFRGKNGESIRGVGLGLYNIRQILYRLNAQISVDSVLGEGTTVRVRVPAHGEIQPLGEPVTDALPG